MYHVPLRNICSCRARSSVGTGCVPCQTRMSLMRCDLADASGKSGRDVPAPSPRQDGSGSGYNLQAGHVPCPVPVQGFRDIRPLPIHRRGRTKEEVTDAIDTQCCAPSMGHVAQYVFPVTIRWLDCMPRSSQMAEVTPPKNAGQRMGCVVVVVVVVFAFDFPLNSEHMTAIGHALNEH